MQRTRLAALASGKSCQNVVYREDLTTVSQEALRVLQLSLMNAVWHEQAQNGGVRGITDQPLPSPCRPLAAVRTLGAAIAFL